MKKSNHLDLRMLLREHLEGMTVQQLAAALGKNESSIKRSLHTMPDAYIDRWVKTPEMRGQYAAVWCVVQVPEHCPRPDVSAKRYGDPKTKWLTVQSTTSH